jgi:glycogen(starch) synthase
VRIVILTRNYPPDTMWGGDAVVYYNLARELSRRGHEVHVICQALSNSYRAQEEGVFVHRVGTDARRYSIIARVNYNLHAWAELLHLMRFNRIDLVEAPDWSAEGFLYCLHKRAPLVITAVGSADYPCAASATLGQITIREILTFFAAIAVRRADAVVAISEDSYNATLRRFGVSATRVFTIPVGIDTERFRPIPSHIRRKLGIEEETELILYVGRLEARNGSLYLCEAIPRVTKRFPRARFVLIGKDTRTAPGGKSFKEYILDQATLSGFLDNLIFIDFLPDDELVQMYSSCDVCVYPAVTSTFGLPALEAMACGKPVVATSVGIIKELGRDANFGLATIPTKDPRAIADGIVRYLELSQEERANLGMANRRLIVCRFSIPAWVDRVLGVYERLLDPHCDCVGQM